MGTNDAAEMLETAKAEVVRLEAALAEQKALVLEVQSRASGDRRLSRTLSAAIEQAREVTRRYPYTGLRYALENVNDGPLASVNTSAALAEHDRALVAEIATAIRRHCTAPSELIGQTDPLLAFVADWIENPPDWVTVSYRQEAKADGSE